MPAINTIQMNRNKLIGIRNIFLIKFIIAVQFCFSILIKPM